MNSKNEKRAVILPESDAPKVNLKFETQINFTTNQAKLVNSQPLASYFRAGLCSFCRCALTDGSIRFNFTAACPNCFAKIEKFNSDMRRYKREYARKFGGQNALKK